MYYIRIPNGTIGDPKLNISKISKKRLYLKIFLNPFFVWQVGALLWDPHPICVGLEMYFDVANATENHHQERNNYHSQGVASHKLTPPEIYSQFQ